MAFKNIYKPKEKEKSIYSSSSAANSSHTAAAGTQNAPRNNVWNAEQSTPRSQSSMVQKPKREKSPSELGEDVVRVMLEDYAQEQQRQAAAGSAAQHDSGAAGMKAAGNRKTAQYGDAADRSGRAALYSSPFAVKPAIGNQKAIPYGGAAAAPYSSPAAAKPAIQKREKSPSELGEEAVRAMLEDEGLLEPPEPEGNEAPAARTFTTGVGRSDVIGADAYAARNAAPGNGFSTAAENVGEDTGPAPATPEELMLAAAPDFAAAGIDTSVLQAGLTLGNTAKQLWDDTHTAPGMPVSAYLLDRVGNTMDTVLEGAWNGIVDYAQAGVNADLERQKQQAQQFSFLGGPYQTYADQITDTARSIQEALPEAAEKFRSHKSAEQAQEIETQNYEALPNEKRSGTLSKEQDSIRHSPHEEWWEKPGASEPIDPNDPAYQALNAELTDNDRAAGLRVVKIDGEYYIDYTTVINTRLHEVEQEFQNHALLNQELMWKNTEWFISQVTGNGPWDIKIADSWKEQFGNVHLPSYMGDTIAYNGQVVTPEKLGNLTYGYLGRAMGWPEAILCLAGGIYNQKELADLATKEGKKWAWINIFNPIVYCNSSYGDGDEDTLFVKMGVELYDSLH